MEYTKNYHLPQWVETDRIMMEDFNNAMTSIENGLDTANRTAAEVQEQLGEELTVLAAEVGSGGKTCRITGGSYVGTGTYGSDKPTVLNIDFKPLAVFISAKDKNGNATGHCVLLFGQPKAKCCASETITVTWSSRSVSWYGTVNHGQNNTANATYFWIAIGVDE